MNKWPKISEVDRIDYFVYQTEFVTKNSMKCLKSLEAHNFFTSGFIPTRPCVKEVNAILFCNFNFVIFLLFIED